MKRWLGVMVGLWALVWAGAGLPAAAQGGPRVQEFTGTVDDSAEYLFYDLHDLVAGETVYAFVEATSGNLDTHLLVGDIDFEETFDEDDDSGGGTNSALEYRVPESCDYSLAVTRHNTESSGGFRLLIGIDAPDVLEGSARPTGDEVAVYWGATPAEGTESGGLTITDCSTLATRPILSGPELRQETDFFVLHYTQEGADGAMDHYVEEVAAILDQVWKREVMEYGWPAPPTDCGEGGDTRYDVYLMNSLDTEDAMGYSMPEELLGDNPNTPPVEEWSTYSYLVIDNDFAGWDGYLGLMRTTVAHEFNHSIQFGYDLNDIGGEWYYEATATWLETLVFPADQDATPYVRNVFATPDLCIGAMPDDAKYDTRIYGEWLLIDSLAQDYGSQAVRRLWEMIAIHEGLDSFYLLADELGTTPQAIVQRYAIRNLLLDYDMAPEITSRVRVESNVNGLGEVTPRASGVQEMAVDYVLVAQPGVYTFSLDQPNLALTVVGIDQPVDSAAVFDLGNRGTVDTRPYTYTYLIIQNTDQHLDSTQCTVTDWVLGVSDGSQSDLAAPEPKLWSAVHFIPAG